MRKLFVLAALIALCVAFVSPADAQTKFRAFTALTGGGTGAIDKIPIAELTNGDIAFTVTTTYFYVHRFDNSATNAESSPTYIRPDDYATAGVWTLQGLFGSTLQGGPSATPSIVLRDSDATDGDDNFKLYINCTDTGSGTEDCDAFIQVQIAGTLTTVIQVDADGNVIFSLPIRATTIELGADTDTTIARVSAGVVSIEGVNIMTATTAQTWTGANSETITNADDTEIAFNGTESIALDLDTGTANQVQWKNKTTGSSGVTEMNFSALNLVTTGTILGAINIVTTTDGTESPTAAQMYGTMFIADHGTATSDTTYTLPGAAAGMAACFYDNGAGTGGIIVNPDDADYILLDGTAMAAGEALHSPGVAGDGANGDFICIVAIDTSNWITLGRSGTWVQETP